MTFLSFWVFVFPGRQPPLQGCVTGMTLVRPIHFISGSQESEPNPNLNRLQLPFVHLLPAKAKLSKESFSQRIHSVRIPMTKSWDKN